MALDHLRPFVFDVRGQALSFCGVGLCDNQLLANVNAVTGFAYQHGAFQWDVDASGGATNGNISLESGAEVEMFASGIGQPAPNLWWNQTPADTNLLNKKDGAPVDRNYVFIARGLMVDLPPAFARESDSASSSRIRPSFLALSEDGANYTAELQQAQANNTAVLLSQSDTGCTYRIGLFKHNPGWVNVPGPGVATNGQFSAPWFVPFAVAFCFGSQDDIRQIKASCVFGQGYVIQNNGGTPVQAVEGDVLYQPFELTFVGNIACVPDCMACGVPGQGDLAVYRQMGLVPVAPNAAPVSMQPALPPGFIRPV